MTLLSLAGSTTVMPNVPQTPSAQAPASLPGFKELIIGDSGTGKTHVIRTLLGTGIQPILLATEPGFRSLSPCDNPACNICGPFGSENRKYPPIPWAYIPPMKPDAPGTVGSLDILIEQANDTLTKTQQELTKVNDKKRKDDFPQFLEVLKMLKDFKDSNGVKYGPVGSWGTDRCLVLDGVSSLGQMAMDMFSGRRALYDKPDYQIAQRAISNLIVYLTMQVTCPVVVIGHVGRGEDSLEGRNKVTINTVGQKLAPELPRMFDDMVHAEREGAVFTWSNVTPGTVAKARNLPLKSGMKPDLSVVVASWKKAGGIIIPSPVVA